MSAAKKLFVVLDRIGNPCLLTGTFSTDNNGYFRLLEGIVQKFEGSYGPNDQHPWRLLYGGDVVIAEKLYEVAVDYVFERKRLERHAITEAMANHRPGWLK